MWDERGSHGSSGSGGEEGASWSACLTMCIGFQNLFIGPFTIGGKMDWDAIADTISWVNKLSGFMVERPGKLLGGLCHDWGGVWLLPGSFLVCALCWRRRGQQGRLGRREANRGDRLLRGGESIGCQSSRGATPGCSSRAVLSGQLGEGVGDTRGFISITGGRGDSGREAHRRAG